MNNSITFTNQTILITGAAGFIGAAVGQKILTNYPHCHVVGLDNLNHYYDVRLKRARLKLLRRYANFTFIHGDLTHARTLRHIFQKYRPQLVIHLAAQAGVGYSITHPENYLRDNIIGFFRVLEACRAYPPLHLVYASSSSVYGEQTAIPYRTDAKVDRPVSFYAATKASDELMAEVYAKLYHLPCTGLRFFTVYGPWGRPDMAYFKFTARLLRGETIELYNDGHNLRDYTYIDDVVDALLRVAVLPPDGHRRLNIGKGHPEDVLTLVQELHAALQQVGLLPADDDLTAHQTLLPPQPGDVPTTYADTTDLVALIGTSPRVTLHDGLQRFATWYRDFCSSPKGVH